MLAFLPLLIRFIGKILDWADADKETRAAFLKFAQTAQAQGLISVKLKDSYESQLDRIKDELWKEQSGGGK